MVDGGFRIEVILLCEAAAITVYDYMDCGQYRNRIMVQRRRSCVQKMATQALMP